MSYVYTVPAQSNFTYARKKSTAFPAPISPKLTIPEQYYVHIRYSNFTHMDNKCGKYRKKFVHIPRKV